MGLRLKEGIPDVDSDLSATQFPWELNKFQQIRRPQTSLIIWTVCLPWWIPKDTFFETDGLVFFLFNALASCEVQAPLCRYGLPKLVNLRRRSRLRVRLCLRLLNHRRQGLYERCPVADSGMVITVFNFWSCEDEWMAVLYRPTGVDLAVFPLPRSVSVLAYLCTRICLR